MCFINTLCLYWGMFWSMCDILITMSQSRLHSLKDPWLPWQQYCTYTDFQVVIGTHIFDECMDTMDGTLE